jgi:pimeloyl-ACP methyl ester carboxylesterase
MPTRAQRRAWPTPATAILRDVTPETQYARVDGLHLAYQILGEGPIDIVLADQWTSHQEAQWDVPPVAEIRRRLAAFGRLITFDKRGVGMSDPVPINALPSIEAWIDDVRAVMDAARSECAALITTMGGGLMGLVFAGDPSRPAARARHRQRLGQGACRVRLPYRPLAGGNQEAGRADGGLGQGLHD